MYQTRVYVGHHDAGGRPVPSSRLVPALARLRRALAETSGGGLTAYTAEGAWRPTTVFELFTPATAWGVSAAAEAYASATGQSAVLVTVARVATAFVEPAQ